MAKILVVGGAGYIGSHMVEMLIQNNHDVYIFDNLCKGHKEHILGGKLIVGDLGQSHDLHALFANHKFDAVMHFAAFIQVGESVKEPAIYYRNNLINTINLLETMLQHNVKKIIFSSTAAVYGEPQYTPIDVNHPKNPLNPYGKSKWMVEQILNDFDIAYDLKSVALRYFNAAGADPAGRIGELHDPETHLIPLVLQVAAKKRKAISIYGDDYNTKDGTCIRDYIHIVDLCSAHLLALESLLKGGQSNAYNLGNGEGYSVLDVIKTAEEVTKCAIPMVKCERRAGDPAVLVADASQAVHDLGWSPKYTDLKTIIEHAWRWEKRKAMNN